jgi:AraC-like DNA-binding protein
MNSVINESIIEFYNERSITSGVDHGAGDYGVFELEHHGFAAARPARYCRRDFYKIALIRGENRCHYAHKSIHLSGPTLVFFNPHVPYTWEPLSDETGFFCIFTALFFSEAFRLDLRKLPMFMTNARPAYSLNTNAGFRISEIFNKMLFEKAARSPHQLDLARTYISELIFSALNMEPSEVLYQHANANARLTGIFLDLLERQFTTVSQYSAPLKLPGQYAKHMNVHVNHLNNAVKQITGKTTSAHIAERTISEARILLKTTQLNIAEIAYLLGFGEQTHFYNFFRRSTGMSPSEYRRGFMA